MGSSWELIEYLVRLFIHIYVRVAASGADLRFRFWRSTFFRDAGIWIFTWGFCSFEASSIDTDRVAEALFEGSRYVGFVVLGFRGGYFSVWGSYHCVFCGSESYDGFIVGAVGFG